MSSLYLHASSSHHRPWVSRSRSPPTQSPSHWQPQLLPPIVAVQMVYARALPYFVVPPFALSSHLQSSPWLSQVFFCADGLIYLCVISIERGRLSTCSLYIVTPLRNTSPSLSEIADQTRITTLGIHYHRVNMLALMRILCTWRVNL